MLECKPGQNLNLKIDYKELIIVIIVWEENDPKANQLTATLAT